MELEDSNWSDTLDRARQAVKTARMLCAQSRQLRAILRTERQRMRQQRAAIRRFPEVVARLKSQGE